MVPGGPRLVVTRLLRRIWLIGHWKILQTHGRVCTRRTEIGKGRRVERSLPTVSRDALNGPRISINLSLSGG